MKKVYVLCVVNVSVDCLTPRLVGLVWCPVLYGGKRASRTIAKTLAILKSSFPTVFNNQPSVILNYYYNVHGEL
jgi:hypothetical protein